MGWEFWILKWKWLGPLDNQFVADGSYIDNLDGVILGKPVSQLGDENLQASTIIGRVVAPQLQQDVSDSTTSLRWSARSRSTSDSRLLSSSAVCP